MAQTIRHNTFETNSSSSHSLCIGVSNELSPSYLTIDYVDNCVHVEFGEFGWGYDETNDQYDKLSYLVTMLVETEGNDCKSMDDLRNAEGFKLIEDVIKEYCYSRNLRIMRYYQLNAVKSIQKAISDDKTRFLFEMATGTGKTLTSIFASNQ